MAESGGFERAFRDNLERYARGPEFANMIGGANASSDAQRTSEGLGIQNIRRGMSHVHAEGPTNPIVVAVSSTFLSLATPLSTTISLSGRPLMIVVSCLADPGAGGEMMFSATLRSTEVTGLTHGFAYAVDAPTVHVQGTWVVPAPSPGTAEVEFVARATTAAGSIYSVAAGYGPRLLAVEL